VFSYTGPGGRGNGGGFISKAFAYGKEREGEKGETYKRILAKKVKGSSLKKGKTTGRKTLYRSSPLIGPGGRERGRGVYGEQSVPDPSLYVMRGPKGKGGGV